MIAYAITDPSRLHFKTLESDLNYFSTQADMIVYRDKISQNYEENAKRFLAAAKGFEKVLLHGDVHLASRLKADGVHLTGREFNEIQNAKDLGLFVIISTHTLDEVVEAEKLGADMVTLSPIFHTPDKGSPLGLETLNNACTLVSIPVIALGGILQQDQIDACRDSGAKGFASIRYFKRRFLSSL
jgi:thiamine-phosphate pyrophosphorylase